jgi:hypothetical protein
MSPIRSTRHTPYGARRMAYGATLCRTARVHPRSQNISKGDVLLRVPLRLAFTDFVDDEESNALLYEVRFGCCVCASVL